MDDETKREVVESYYRIIDEEAFDELETVVADDIAYVTDHGTMRGSDRMYAYYTEERTVTNTTHDTFRRVIDGDVLLTEGAVDGEYVDGGEFDGGYVGVFEFDDETGEITELTVYTRSVF